MILVFGRRGGPGRRKPTEQEATHITTKAIAGKVVMTMLRVGSLGGVLDELRVEMTPAEMRALMCDGYAVSYEAEELAETIGGEHLDNRRANPCA